MLEEGVLGEPTFVCFCPCVWVIGSEILTLDYFWKDG